MFLVDHPDCYVEIRHPCQLRPHHLLHTHPGHTPLKMQPPWAWAGGSGIFLGHLVPHVTLHPNLKGTDWPLCKPCPHTPQKGGSQALLQKPRGPAKSWCFLALCREVALNVSFYEGIFPKHHRSRLERVVSCSVPVREDTSKSASVLSSFAGPSIAFFLLAPGPPVGSFSVCT